MSSKLVLVTTFPSSEEAELAKTRLNESGIYSIVGSNAAGVRPELHFSEGITISVHSQNLEEARKILCLDKK